jgi:hypothetical protein
MSPSHYKNFAVAIYCRAYEVEQMRDLNYLTSNFEIISRWIKINKVYLETHRDLLVPDEATISRAKHYLESRGVKVSGGITITVNERNRFETYCYTNPTHRQKLKEVAAYDAMFLLTGLSNLYKTRGNKLFFLLVSQFFR